MTNINNKRDLMCVFLIIITIFTTLSVPALANNDVLVMLDGKILEFDVQPQIISGRTMVPMRKIFESLGASVEWDGATQKITAKRQDTTVIMQIDSNVLSVNGNAIILDVPPQLVSGRTLVPVRAVAESFKIHVSWDSSLNSVLLSTLIPFDSSIQAFDYLCNWLIENGSTYGEYVYIEKFPDEGVLADIRYYPESGNIAFYLSSYENDGMLTAINLWPTYDGKDIYATYISGSETCRITGDINKALFTSNYPLSYKECDPGEFETSYSLLENTRKRINYLLEICDMLLSENGTKVTLNTLGFKSY